MAGKRLVRWERFPEIRATPQRVEELEARYVRNKRRADEAARRARQMKGALDRWFWC